MQSILTNTKIKLKKYDDIFKFYDKLYESISKQFRTFEKKMAIEVGIYMSLKNDNAVTKQNKKSKFFM